MEAYNGNYSHELKWNTIKTLKVLEENYNIIEPIQVRKVDARTAFVLNTAEGTKFFVQENATNELSEFHVEDKFRLGDVIVEKNKGKKQNIFKKMTTKLLQVLNAKQQDTKLLTTGSQSSIQFQNNIYTGDKMFSDREIQKNEVIYLEEDKGKFEKEPEKTIKKFSANIWNEEFREKYKVDTTELKSVEQEKQNVQNNIEEKER